MNESDIGMSVRLEAEAWASPREGMTLDGLVARLRELGHTILAVDREGNRVKVLDTKEGA